ncbi:MAG: AbrB/MazE/SpoVT family DNA-binding domain-containing protein [Boseongicola sp. SB0675_bin_26]|nr:AbrB/MazE/SpoVT family DNA-binding domain-containing protein [Boseongicola sp. SB0675_bin_26]
MSDAPRLTTTASSKGQVVLPKVVRQSRRWEAGTRPAVEDMADGVPLKPLPVIASTRLADVFGILASTGTPRTLAEMQAGIMAEGRRHAGD